jgi:hypothetical protein
MRVEWNADASFAELVHCFPAVSGLADVPRTSVLPTLGRNDEVDGFARHSIARKRFLQRNGTVCTRRRVFPTVGVSDLAIVECAVDRLSRNREILLRHLRSRKVVEKVSVRCKTARRDSQSCDDEESRDVMDWHSGMNGVHRLERRGHRNMPALATVVSRNVGSDRAPRDRVGRLAALILTLSYIPRGSFVFTFLDRVGSPIASPASDT